MSVRRWLPRSMPLRLTLPELKQRTLNSPRFDGGRKAKRESHLRSDGISVAPMVAEIFAQRFTIDPADIDELGHVNNIVYLRWAQEMAIAHWRARADAAQLADYVWVVTRHEADYRAPLELGEEVEARTWVEDAPRGAIWARFVDIGLAGTARPAAQIKSYWCLLDAATRRPKRVRGELIARFVNQKSG